MGTICWVCFFSSSVTECGLWCWPYSLRVTLSLPPHRGTLKYWDYRNMTIFWKNLIVVTPMGYYPWTQNVFLGHWFHNVLGIPPFSYFVSQPWVQQNIHLLSYIGTAPSILQQEVASHFSWFTLLVEKIVSYGIIWYRRNSSTDFCVDSQNNFKIAF